MRRTFLPSQHSGQADRTYGESGGYYRPATPPRHYELFAEWQADALLKALGLRSSVGRKVTRKGERNWEIILVGVYPYTDQYPKGHIELLAWDTTSSLKDKISSIDPEIIKSVVSTTYWDSSGKEAAYIEYKKRLREMVADALAEAERAEAPSTTTPAATPSSARPKTPVRSSDESSVAPTEDDSGGGSSFPWLPVIGGSVLVLGVGGYLYYKRRKAA